MEIRAKSVNQTNHCKIIDTIRTNINCIIYHCTCTSLWCDGISLKSVDISCICRVVLIYTAPVCIVKWGINDQHVVQWGVFSWTVYCFVAHCFRNVYLILSILYKVVACFDVTKYILIVSEIPEIARSHILSFAGWLWLYCEEISRLHVVYMKYEIIFRIISQMNFVKHDDVHGNDFRINGLLWGIRRSQQCKTLMFSLLLAWASCWANSRVVDDLRCHER